MRGIAWEGAARFCWCLVTELDAARHRGRVVKKRRVRRSRQPAPRSGKVAVPPRARGTPRGLFNRASSSQITCPVAFLTRVAWAERWGEDVHSFTARFILGCCFAASWDVAWCWGWRRQPFPGRFLGWPQVLDVCCIH